MSARSTTQSTTGSVRGSVKLAGEEAKDRMYEPKHKKKVVRVLTVIAYVFSVSLAAIMLSMYYIFIWQGKPSQSHQHGLYHSTGPQCPPAGSGGVNHGQAHLPQMPVYNESQVVETPRALPAHEELTTTPLPRLAQHHLPLPAEHHHENSTLLAPVAS